MPEDGQADPVGVTNVLAKAAKIEGVTIFEKTPVEKILVKNKKLLVFKLNLEKLTVSMLFLQLECGQDK